MLNKIISAIDSGKVYDNINGIICIKNDCIMLNENDDINKIIKIINSGNLKELYIDNIYSDFTIIINNEKYYLHKEIIKKNIDVSNNIKIKYDGDTSSIGRIINYLYTENYAYNNDYDELKNDYKLSKLLKIDSLTKNILQKIIDKCLNDCKNDDLNKFVKIYNMEIHSESIFFDILYGNESFQLFQNKFDNFSNNKIIIYQYDYFTKNAIELHEELKNQNNEKDSDAFCEDFENVFGYKIYNDKGKKQYGDDFKKIQKMFIEDLRFVYKNNISLFDEIDKTIYIKNIDFPKIIELLKKTKKIKLCCHIIDYDIFNYLDDPSLINLVKIKNKKTHDELLLKYPEHKKIIMNKKYLEYNKKNINKFFNSISNFIDTSNT